MLVSACTIGEEETKGVVSLEESVSSTTIIEQVTFEEGVLNFAQCMREEGIDFPDPSFDIDGNPEFDNLDIENEEEFEEALDKRRKIIDPIFNLIPKTYQTWNGEYGVESLEKKAQAIWDYIMREIKAFCNNTII